MTNLAYSGHSLVAIDPGTTTGIAVWDAYTETLYVDQIDAGRGRKVRQNVHSGVIESPRRRKSEVNKSLQLDGQFPDAAKRPPHLAPPGSRERSVKTGNGLRAGLQSEMEVLDDIEAGVTQLICDVVRAVGPGGFFICEDFILGITGGASSGKRAGLSPVRIRSRLRCQMELEGFLNGDAWRVWKGGVWTGKDLRGLHVRELEDGARYVQEVNPGGGQWSLAQRLGWVENWRLGLDGAGFNNLETGRDKKYPEVLWGGSGVKWLDRLPGERWWLKGGETACKEWMKQNGTYAKGLPHGMDALAHLIVGMRRIGARIPNRWIRIWEPRFEVSEKRKNWKVEKS